MTTDTQWATDLYSQLKPEARHAARNYILSRTPSTIQDEMIAVFEADMADIADQLQVPVVVDSPFINQVGAGVGSTITSTLGNWEGSPTSRSYQWKRGATSVGSNAAIYIVTAPDIGQTFTCIMTASNAAGASTPTTSNAIVVV